MEGNGRYLSIGLLTLVVASGCATPPSQPLEGGVVVQGRGMIVADDHESLLIPEIEEDRRLFVALIAVDSLDRSGATVRVTRNTGPGAAAFVEVAEEASASDVRRALARVGVSYASNPDELEGPAVTYIQPVDDVSFQFDDDPYFEQVVQGVERVRNIDELSVVNGYGEAYALIMGGWISELIGSAVQLVRDP